MTHGLLMKIKCIFSTVHFPESRLNTEWSFMQNVKKGAKQWSSQLRLGSGSGGIP